MSNAVWIFLGGLASNVLIGVFIYGRLTERVASQGQRLTNVEEVVTDHTTRIAVLETKHGIRMH
jgi:hypothetical protein